MSKHNSNFLQSYKNKKFIANYSTKNNYLLDFVTFEGYNSGCQGCNPQKFVVIGFGVFVFNYTLTFR